MHVRRKIRDEIISKVTRLNTTGTNVFPHRVYPVQESALPAIIVYTSSESSARATLGGFASVVSMHRNLNVTIEVYVKATKNMVDILDQIAEEIEVAMGDDETLSGLSEDLFLTGTSIEITAEGDQPVGLLKLDYQVDYRTTNDPSTAL